MAKVRVGSGESAVSIAKKNGFFWKTVWNHGENAVLKEKRKDPSLLYEDDEIFIPKKRKKEVSKATEAEHTFKIKGEPCKLKLQLLKLGDPRKNEDYVIEVNGERIEGTTDSEGKLEHFIPGDANNGTLILRNGMETYPIRIGDLDPIDKTPPRICLGRAARGRVPQAASGGCSGALGISVRRRICERRPGLAERCLLSALFESCLITSAYSASSGAATKLG